MVEGNSTDFDIRNYLIIIKKRRYLALSIALAVISVFTWGSFLLPKTYEASSTVFVDRSTLIEPLIKGVGVSTSMEERLRSLKESITSRNIIVRVIKKLDLDTKIKNEGQYENLAEGIRKNLNITTKSAGRERETDLFIVAYKDKNPKTASDFVNTLVSEYIEENIGYRRTDAFGAYEFIDKQLLEYKGRLEESDKAIRTFREKNPRLIPQSETAVMSRLEGFQTSMIESEIRLKELTRKKTNIEKQLSGEKEMTVAFVTKGSPQDRLTALNNQLMTLVAKYTENHPEVIRLKIEIEDIKRQISQPKDSLPETQGSETSALNPIYQQLKEELTKTDNEIESLRARISEVSRQQQMTQSVLGKMPRELEEWTKLQRDRNVYQKIYDELVQKLESAKVSKDIELTDKNTKFRIVDPAVAPQFPVFPNRIKIILIGAALGLALGIGIPIWLDNLANSFKSDSSIEEKLKMPVLTMIPKIIVQEEELSQKRFDRRIFAASAAYLLIIGLVLAIEVLNRYLGISIIKF